MCKCGAAIATHASSCRTYVNQICWFLMAFTFRVWSFRVCFKLKFVFRIAVPKMMGRWRHAQWCPEFHLTYPTMPTLPIGSNARAATAWAGGLSSRRTRDWTAAELWIDSESPRMTSWRKKRTLRLSHRRIFSRISNHNVPHIYSEHKRFRIRNILTFRLFNHTRCLTSFL